MSKKKIILGIILTLLLAVSILIVYSVSSLDELVIKGNTYYSEKSLKKMLIDKKIYNNTFALYIKLKYGPKLSIPFIDETDVDLKGPHSLVVRVYEKDIIGCIPYMGEYVCFDKDGIMVGSITEKRKDVPVVTGIEYNKIV